MTWTQRRVEKVWAQMEKLGIRPERLQLEWISAAEGQKFARVMREVDRLLREVTPHEVAETIKILEAKELGSAPVLTAPAPAAEPVLPVVTN